MQTESVISPAGNSPAAVDDELADFSTNRRVSKTGWSASSRAATLSGPCGEAHRPN
jgi:hypothetical protein